MENFRIYGNPPFDAALLHGGPGAPGGMKPVAEELSSKFSILEPFQSAKSVDGQIDELAKILEQNANKPIVLVGWSWGAWLALLFTAKYEKLVSKVIIIGSGPFEAEYAKQIGPTRMERLAEEERSEFEQIMKEIEMESANKNELFARVGKLFDKTDNFNLIPHESESEVQFDVYDRIWPEAAEMRASGELLERIKNIKCEIVAIHGSYDPHPAEGVKVPLEKIFKKFKFIEMENTGHTPWYEHEARDKFFEILESEITPAI